MGKARWVFPKISNSIQTGRFINYEMIYHFRIHWNWKVTNLQTNVAESQANVEKEMEELREVVTKQKARMWLNFVFFRFVEMKSFQYLKKGLLCHCYTNSFIPLFTSRCPFFIFQIVIVIVILVVIVIDQDESDARLLELKENYKSEMKALKTDIVAWTEVSLGVGHMLKIPVICDIWFKIVMVREHKLVSQNLRIFWKNLVACWSPALLSGSGEPASGGGDGSK